MAASWSVIVPWSSFHAARSVSSSAASSSVAMSASWKPTPWKRPIGWPNCSPVGRPRGRHVEHPAGAADAGRRDREPAGAEPLAHQVEAAALLAEPVAPTGTRQPSKTSSQWW